MNAVLLAQGSATDRLALGVAACLIGAALSLFGRRAPRLGSGAVLFVFGISAAATLTVINLHQVRLAPVPQVAWTFAVVSVLWSTGAAFIPRPGDLHPGSPHIRLHTSSVFRLAALLFGVAAVITQVVILVMRLIGAGIDLFHGYPWGEPARLGFGPEGLWTLLALLASCGIGLATTRDRRLIVCLLWIAVLIVLWSCLLLSPFTMHVTGGFERSTMTVWMMAALSGLLLLCGGCDRVRHRNSSSPAVPGLTASCAVLGAAVIVLGCYHLLVPVRFPWLGIHGSLLMLCVSTAAGAWGASLLLARCWHDGLADAAFGLLTAALCGLAVLAVPFGTSSLSEVYPMIFNAIMVGLAAATGIWTYLAGAWQAPQRSVAAAPLIPHAKRCAFLAAALGLVAGALMTCWPRMPAVAAMDHTIGRVTAGFAAQLFLLLMMLWASRRIRRLTFHLLTVLAVFTTAGFVLIRMIPFVSRVE